MPYSKTELKKCYKYRTYEGDKFWLDDSHCHYPAIKDKAHLEELLENITPKLGRTAITTWGEQVKKRLHYREFVEALKDYSINHPLTVRDNGPVSILIYKERITEIYPSQEIRTASHLHITAEGCENLIPEHLDPRKTIELIHKEGGIALVEHPCTKVHPIKQYCPTTEDDDRLTLEVFGMADAAEAFNSYNTLWMKRQNDKAKALIEKHGRIAGIAGSDNHFGLVDGLARKLFYINLGRTGTYFPYYNNFNLPGKQIIERKRKDLRERNYHTLENYTGPITFFMEMIPPIIARKLKLDEDSIS